MHDCTVEGNDITLWGYVTLGKNKINPVHKLYTMAVSTVFGDNAWSQCAVVLRQQLNAPPDSPLREDSTHTVQQCIYFTIVLDVSVKTKIPSPAGN
jgi:hypothetical protein